VRDDVKSLSLHPAQAARAILFKFAPSAFGPHNHFFAARRTALSGSIETIRSVHE